jgi:hypothetical protein
MEIWPVNMEEEIAGPANAGHDAYAEGFPILIGRYIGTDWALINTDLQQ